MEKHENREAKGRGASLDPMAGGLLRVPSLQNSNPGLLYKQTQSAGSMSHKRSQFASNRRGRPSPRPEGPSQGSGQALEDATRCQEQARRTKPIRAGRPYKQTQSVGELSRQTKPIRRRLPGGHSRAGGNPGTSGLSWTPAFAGVTERGVGAHSVRESKCLWGKGL